MTSTSSRLLRAPLLALLIASTAAAAVPDPRVSTVEQVYADWLDADYAVLTLAAGPLTAVGGRDAVAWQATLSERQSALAVGLARLHGVRLSPEDARAREMMERTLADVPTVPAASTAGQSAALCDRATETDADRSLLSRALYACFEHFGNHIAFEGGSIVRATALELLQELDSGERRRALFTALAPLWERINARSAADSPYRRLIRLSAAEARDKGASPVSEAARTVGATTAQVETWLVAVLEAWRAVNPGPPLEPWDYWHHYAGGVVPLDGLIPPDLVLPLSLRYYRDLGADLDALGVLHDLAVRPGKAPLAYTDYVRIGRQTADGWRPAIGRVSANVEHGGLFVLNEIVHEDGHAVHMAAVRTRPAFYGLGDDLFLEAFADVPSWSVAEPRWQNRYLGQSIDESTSLRALFGNVMLDVAWGLFELRMLREPESDPNAVWTAITAHYLNVRPHPEMSWWALRVQLADVPGYMINYGLGAIVTAEMRQRIRRGIGDFDSGNPRWYRFTTQHLLKFGSAIETPELLRSFLGHPVSSEALLSQLARIAPPAPH